MGLEFVTFFPKNIKNLLSIVLDNEIPVDVFVDSNLGIIYDFIYTYIPTLELRLQFNILLSKCEVLKENHLTLTFGILHTFYLSHGKNDSIDVRHSPT